MKKKDKSFLLRIDSTTYDIIKREADKYDRSVNSEIYLLLVAITTKWDKRKVEITDIPPVVKSIQDNDWEATYNQALKDMGYSEEEIKNTKTYEQRTGKQK